MWHNKYYNKYNTLHLEQFIEKLKDNKEKNIESLNLLVQSLRLDSINLNNELFSIQKKYADLNTTYDLLSSKSSRYMAEKANETKELLNQLVSYSSSHLRDSVFITS